jgi:hypothetical protein
MPTLLDIGRLEQPNKPEVVPIRYVVDHVLADLTRPVSAPNPFNNRLLILEARTASGKSVTVPPWIQIAFRSLPERARKIVLCTQPRILTTIEIPKELDKQNYFADQGVKFKLGQDLGYQTSALALAPQQSGLLYATLGTLEAQLKSEMDRPERFCRRYSSLIIDEAHERSIAFDSTMALLKIFFMRNRERADLPYIIMMSATFDVIKYAQFFNVLPRRSAHNEQPHADVHGAPTLTQAVAQPSWLEEAARVCPNIVRVGGASYPIDERYPTASVPNIYEAFGTAIRSCIDEELAALDTPLAVPRTICENRILVFVPGQSDGRQVKQTLTKEKYLTPEGVTREINGQRIRIVVDYSYVDSNSIKTASADYVKVLGSAEVPGDRLPTFVMGVIVTTAVAETGLSLEKLKYVIDCGLSKESEFNPVKNISSMLLTRPAAQSRIMQRRGRVGRKKPGVFIPLYTKATFDVLEKDQVPEILKTDPTALILTLIAYSPAAPSAIEGISSSKLGSPDEVRDQLLDVPTKPAMTYALHKLQLQGFIDEDFAITATGRIASRITNVLSTESIATIFAGFTWGCCIDDLIAIGIMMRSRFGDKGYVGRTEAEKAELKKQKKFDEVARNDPTPVERERLYGSFGGAGAVSGGNDPWTGGDEPRSNPRSLYYPLRVLIADDFIEQLVPFRALEEQFEKLGFERREGGAPHGAPFKRKGHVDKAVLPIGDNTSNSARYARLERWAKSCFLKLDRLLEAYSDYVDVKSSLCAAGIDITAGREHALLPLLQTVTDAHPIAPEALTDMLTRLKLCLFHGYKMNSAETAGPGLYRMVYGGHVFPWSFFGGDAVWRKYEAPYTYMPQRIIINSTFVNARKGKYQFTVQGVGVLDGYC